MQTLIPMTTPFPLTELPARPIKRLDHLSQAVIEVLDLAEPVARDCGTQILVALPPHLPVLAVTVDTFHDLLLRLLALVLDLSCGDSTNLQVRLAPDSVEFEVRCLSSKNESFDPAALGQLKQAVESEAGTIENASTLNEPALCMRLPIVR